MVYDLIILGILLVAVIRGAAKGMAWQLATIASLVLCFLFATPLSVPVAQMIKVDPPLNRWLAMVGIYIGFSLVCFGAARAVRGWLEKARFVEYDRHLGAMFGLVKGAIFCFVLTFFLVGFSGPMAEYVINTKTGYATAVAVEQMHVVMPAELVDAIHPYLEKFPHAEPEGWDNGRQQHAEDDSQRTVKDGTPRNRYRPRDDFRGNRAPEIQDPFANPLPPDPLESEPEVLPSIPDPAQKELSLEGLVDQVSEFVGSKTKEAVNKSLEGMLNPPTPTSSTPARPLPVESPLVAPRDPQVPAQQIDRNQLTASIAALFSSSPNVRQTIKGDIESQLQGVPLSVAEGALRDWYGDLMGLSPDVDPDTDVTADLATRLARQSGR